MGRTQRGKEAFAVISKVGQQKLVALRYEGVKRWYSGSSHWNNWVKRKSEKLVQLNNRKTSTPLNTGTEVTWMANRHLKRCSVLLAIREMQIKAMRYH